MMMMMVKLFPSNNKGNVRDSINKHNTQERYENTGMETWNLFIYLFFFDFHNV